MPEGFPLKSNNEDSQKQYREQVKRDAIAMLGGTSNEIKDVMYFKQNANGYHDGDKKIHGPGERSAGYIVRIDGEMEKEAREAVEKSTENTGAKERLEKIKNSTLILKSFPAFSSRSAMSGIIKGKDVNIIFQMKNGTPVPILSQMDNASLSQEEALKILNEYVDIAKDRTSRIEQKFEENL